MSSNPNIYLVGPMGAGKTTIGKRIAQIKGMAFSDADAELEGRTGVDISFIFEKEGEAGFRKREARMITELTELPNTVLATGGGAVLESANRDLLSARGIVVYLETSVEQQLKRTQHNRNRPLLEESDDIEQTLRELMAERDPLYRQIADLVVTTGDQPARRLAREIVEQLETISNAEL